MATEIEKLKTQRSELAEALRRIFEISKDAPMTHNIRTIFHLCEGALDSELLAPAVPSRWKVVPVEPTKAMLNQAADNLCGRFGIDYVAPKEDFARSAYEELVAAAPQPPDERWRASIDEPPKEADADPFRQVWGSYRDGDVDVVSVDLVQAMPHSWAYWKPTGIRRPDPPQQGAQH